MFVLPLFGPFGNIEMQIFYSILSISRTTQSCARKHVNLCQVVNPTQLKRFQTAHIPASIVATISQFSGALSYIGTAM